MNTDLTAYYAPFLYDTSIPPPSPEEGNPRGPMTPPSELNIRLDDEYEVSKQHWVGPWEHHRLVSAFLDGQGLWLEREGMVRMKEDAACGEADQWPDRGPSIV